MSSLFKKKPDTALVEAAAIATTPDVEHSKADALKMVSVRFTRHQWRQLKEFALDEETSLQALIVDAIAEKMARKGLTFPK